MINEIEWNPKGDKRSYEPRGGPTLRSGFPVTDPAQIATLRILYQEVSSNWRQYMDVRFKLLNLVPIASILTLITIFNTNLNNLPNFLRIFIFIFGFIFTIGLFIYNQRNTELYDDLNDRGKIIEQELGIINGHFKGRLVSSHRWLGIKIQHDIGIYIIYYMTMISWLFGILLVVLDTL